MKLTGILLIALSGLSSAQSWVHGASVSAPRGQVFYGQIGTFNLCGGQDITAVYAQVNWGDGSGITGAEIPDPLYLGRILGSHNYKTAGTFTISITLTAACWFEAGNYQKWWGDTASGTATAIVPPDIPVSSIVLSPNTVVRGGSVTATITVANPVPSWGGLVQAGVSDSTAAAVPPGIVIPSGISATTTIGTQTFTGAARNVTITAVSAGVSVSAVLRVR